MLTQEQILHFKDTMARRYGFYVLAKEISHDLFL